jgi:hypothetical protein
MLMFLSILCAGLLVVAVCAAILSTFEPAEPAPPVETRPAVEQRFFAKDAVPASTGPSLPFDLVLSQIERHVRLEQLAAERFLNVPSPESLHSPTSSPFVN